MIGHGNNDADADDGGVAGYCVSRVAQLRNGSVSYPVSVLTMVVLLV